MAIATSAPPKRVLLAETDAAARTAMAEWLIAQGYEVLAARDGLHALTLYQQNDLDVVLLDRDLPGHSAFDICREIQEHQEHASLPIILTGMVDGEDEYVEAFQAGAQDYLKKPLRCEELCARVEHALSSSQLRRELAQRNLALSSELSAGQDELQQMNRKLKLQLLNQRALFDVSQQLNSSIDADEQINILLLTVMGQLGVDMATIFTADGDSDYIGLHSAKGVDPSGITSVALHEEEAFLRYLQANPTATMLRDLPLGVNTGTHLKRLLQLGFVAGCPIHIGPRLAGVLVLGPKMNGRPMGEHDFVLLASIAVSAGIAMEKADLFRKLQESYVTTIQSLMSAMEAKDTYTRGHTARVSRYALAIAEAMGFNKEAMEDVRFGATLHDIGKIGIHEEILNKPGQLSEAERALMNEHPSTGDRILRKINFLKNARKMVRHHHERWDGQGYPDGLHSEEISIGARIVAVADAFDAMTSQRTYSSGMGLEDAIYNLTSKTHSTLR